MKKTLGMKVNQDEKVFGFHVSFQDSNAFPLVGAAGSRPAFGNKREPQMNQEQRVHRRGTIRLQGYDYAQPGAYYVTLCTYEKTPLFGNVSGSTVTLNGFGKIADQEWKGSENVRKEIAMDEYVVMPNHLHGIVWIREGVEEHTSSPLGSMIQGYKSMVTKRINALRKTAGRPVWQRNYWERIIRNTAELEKFQTYIRNNPANWANDSLNLQSSGGMM